MISKALLFRFLVACAAPLVFVSSSRPASPPANAACPKPSVLRFDVDHIIQRRETGFTQGLHFHEGQLWESTGRYGGSRINRISPDGAVERIVELDDSHFGEGLTILNGEVFQLTWRNNKVFVYDLEGALLRQLENPREGWGLAHLGDTLVFGDGGNTLYLADPITFRTVDRIRVFLQSNPVPYLNELEVVDGALFANVYGSLAIVRIEPATGCVDGVADMSPLLLRMTDEQREDVKRGYDHVLNGIAHDPTSGHFFITGKNWPQIFVLRISG